jgi:hypothetical protein
MTQYLFIYRVPRDFERGTQSAEWQRWFEGLGDAVVDIGNPTFERTTIGADVGATTELGGYSLIEAASLADAQAHATGCPILSVGGSVEVGVVTPLSEMAAAS